MRSRTAWNPRTGTAFPSAGLLLLVVVLGLHGALFGCGPAGAVPARPSPYIYNPADPPIPAIDPTTLGGVIERAIADVFALDVQLLLDTYDGFVAGAEPGGCPLTTRGTESYTDTVYWQDSCTTAGGTRFNGYSIAYTYQDLPQDGLLLTGRVLFHSITMEQAAGERYDGSGSAVLLEGDSANFHAWVKGADGTFVADSPATAGTWIDGSLAPAITVVAAIATATGGHFVQFDGGISGLRGALDTIVLTEVRILEAAAGSSCEREPSGVVSIRASDGEWYDVVFDGPTEKNPNTPPELCDGCGAVWFRGSEIGQACVDLSFLFTWGARPW